MNFSLTPLRAFAAACALLAAGVPVTAQTDPDPVLTPDEKAILALQSAFVRTVTPGERADFHRDLLATVMLRVKRSHATDVDMPIFAAAAIKVLEPLPAGTGEPAEVFKKSVNTALRTLDPQSRYYDPTAFDTQRGDSTGSFGGLGIEIQPSEGAVRVVAPMPGSPAARAGVTAGDLIVRVDDQSVVGIPLADAIAKMRGAPGTPVTITIRRAGEPQELTVSLKRDTIRRQLIRSSMEGDVLVLSLSSFSGPVSTAMEQAITEATATTQPKALMLDLRGNPGGLLREAIRIADAFLDKGEIVSLRGSTPARQRAWQADATQLLAGVPMVVLIDMGSASASELVADALQHSGRATVMGGRSYGKGSVQTTFSLGDNRGALRLTTALYHGPSGQTVHRTGVGPDIELQATAPTASDNANWEAGAKPLRTAQARVDPARCKALKERDPVLSCAVAYLQAGSVDAFVSRLAER